MISVRGAAWGRLLLDGGFPAALVVQTPPASAGEVRDTSSLPGGELGGDPAPVRLPGESLGQRGPAAAARGRRLGHDWALGTEGTSRRASGEKGGRRFAEELGCSARPAEAAADPRWRSGVGGPWRGVSSWGRWPDR